MHLQNLLGLLNSNFFFRKLGFFDKGVEINIEALCREYRLSNNYKGALTLPVLDALVKNYMASNHAQWAVGGYMEWRPSRFEGTYLSAQNKYLHLGVDYYAHGTSEVYAPCGDVLHADYSNNETPGWGGRVFLQPKQLPDTVFLFCHLTQALPAVGLYTGVAPLGQLGDSHENGGVVPHLHVQAMPFIAFEEYKKTNFASLDGYAPLVEKDRGIMAVAPDPRALMLSLMLGQKNLEMLETFEVFAMFNCGLRGAEAGLLPQLAQ